MESNMKKYEIEHIGISVREPIEMANWYQEVLGFNIKFSAQDKEKGVVFLTDSNDRVMLEFGKIPNVLPLTDRINHWRHHRTSPYKPILGPGQKTFLPFRCVIMHSSGKSVI